MSAAAMSHGRLPSWWQALLLLALSALAWAVVVLLLIYVPIVGTILVILLIAVGLVTMLTRDPFR